MMLSKESMHELYDLFDKDTNQYIAEYQNAMPVETNTDFDLSGISMGILGEAFAMLKKTYTILRATKESDEISDLSGPIFTISRMLNAMIVQYIDDSGLDSDTILRLCEDDINQITLVDFDDCDFLIRQYLDAYAQMYPGAMDSNEILKSHLYKQK